VRYVAIYQFILFRIKSDRVSPRIDFLPTKELKAKIPFSYLNYITNISRV